MSDWSAVRHIPMYVPGVVAKLTGVVHKLVGQEPSGYWAEFRFSDNPNYVSIRSYSGKFEDECHGAFYHLRDARAYYRRLRQAGFLLSPRRYAVDVEVIKEIGFVAWDDKETVCLWV